MKKYLILILVCALLAPQMSLALEKIEFFDATIQIKSNSTLEIEEMIVVDFGTEEKLGIIREIQTNYNGQIISIKKIEVRGVDGKKIDFETYKNNNDDQVIQIGDKKNYQTGVQVYNISYLVENAITFGEEIDSVNWNVTGTNWPIKIDAVEASIILPQPISKELITADCSIKKTDSEKECNLKEFVSFNSSTGYTFTENNLESDENLTLKLTFPKNYAIENTSVLANFLKFFGIVILVTFAFVVFKRIRK